MRVAQTLVFLLVAVAAFGLAGVLMRSAHLPHSHPCTLQQQHHLEQWPLQAKLASPQLQQQQQARNPEGGAPKGRQRRWKSFEDRMREREQAAFGGIASDPNTLAQGVPVQLVARAGSACSPDNMTMPTGMRLAADKLLSPVVIVAHERNQYLAKSLLGVLRYWDQDPDLAERFPLFVSVEGNDTVTLQVAASFSLLGVRAIQHHQDPACGSPGGRSQYCNIALHYKMLLQLFFICMRAPRLIFLEEDMIISPDFFDFFQATAPVLDSDPSIWCISAWNDHGQVGRASNSSALYRTDVLPGLGWMVNAHVGRQLHGSWPSTYWDTFLRRDQELRQGRQCVFPEVARTHTFGRQGGASGARFHGRHLDKMLLNRVAVDWKAVNMTYLLRDNYRLTMASWLAAAVPLNLSGDALQAFCSIDQPNDTDGRDMLLHYADLEAFESLAHLSLKPMVGEVDAGAPRCSYNGIVTIRCKGRRLFLAPPAALETLKQARSLQP